MGRLVFDEPHRPAGDDDGTDQENEAEGSEADHHFGGGALGDAEDYRDAEREDKHSGEVRQHQSEAFLPLASECASTAAMMLRRPPTIRKFLP